MIRSDAEEVVTWKERKLNVYGILWVKTGDDVYGSNFPFLVSCWDGYVDWWEFVNLIKLPNNFKQNIESLYVRNFLEINIEKFKDLCFLLQKGHIWSYSLENPLSESFGGHFYGERGVLRRLHLDNVFWWGRVQLKYVFVFCVVMLYGNVDWAKDILFGTDSTIGAQNSNCDFTVKDIHGYVKIDSWVEGVVPNPCIVDFYCLFENPLRAERHSALKGANNEISFSRFMSRYSYQVRAIETERMRRRSHQYFSLTVIATNSKRFRRRFHQSFQLIFIIDRRYRYFGLSTADNLHYLKRFIS